MRGKDIVVKTKGPPVAVQVVSVTTVVTLPSEYICNIKEKNGKEGEEKEREKSKGV